MASKFFFSFLFVFAVFFAIGLNAAAKPQIESDKKVIDFSSNVMALSFYGWFISAIWWIWS